MIRQHPIEAKATLHPIVRDVFISGVTSVIISGSSLLVVSLLGRLSDSAAVSEYLLMRRVAAWILSGVLLGITMALPRYVAHAVNRPALQTTYFLAAADLAMAATALVAAITCLPSATFAPVLFGAPHSRPLLL